MKRIEDLYLDLKDVATNFEQIQNDILETMGVETLRETADVFDEQSFDGRDWGNRKYELRQQAGKKLLSDSTLLKKSIRYARGIDKESVTIGVDLNLVPYAEIQNEGGKIEITDKMRKFFWAKYYELKKIVDADLEKKEAQKKALSEKNKVRGESGKKLLKGRKEITSELVKKSGNDAEFWKNMALTKNTHIEIPQRQYLGVTDRLESRWERAIKRVIKKALKDD